MLMICPKVISNLPEGLEQSLDVMHKHAQELKLKENIKKSNIIIFSSNGHLVVMPMQGKSLAKRFLKINSLHNTPIQEKTSSCMEARPKGPPTFVTPGGKNKWVVEKVSRWSK